jgi:hypothetical protein
VRASRSGKTCLLVAAVLLGIAASGCGTKRDGASGKGAPGSASVPLSALGTSANLGGEVVARVGDTNITSAMVRSVARAQHVSTEAAMRLLIDEAILAEAARREGATSTATVKQGSTAALGNAIVTKFREEALARGEITDAELDAVLSAGEEWMELDRPETRKADHALVPKDVPDGEAIARKLRDAVASAPTPEAFLESARTFAAGSGLPPTKIIVESLPAPFTEDGRVVQHGGGTFALPFTKAAFAIPAVGDTSDVVWNPEFGWHVIRLAAILPPVHTSRDQLVVALQGQVVRARIGSAFQDLVAKLREDAHVQMLADEASLMAARFSSPVVASPP